MKRIISNVMLIAAAATAFFSCQKQESLAPEKAQDVVLTFSSEKPSFTDETKTEWTGTTVQWSAGDKISIAYTVDGVWMGFEKTEEDQTVVRSKPKLYKSESLTEATEVAKFNVSNSFNIADEGAHIFYGVYPAPSATAFDDAPVANLSVPALQTPNANSFDGAADLMTGVSVDAFNSIAEAKAENISMKWTRLVAHANITLKALKDVTAGEKVLSITLTAQDDANLVGKQKVNILTNEFENNDATSNVLKINGANLSVDSGNIEFWACVLPETITALTVVVDTDKATYTREITGISNKTFKQNARNILSINMSEAMREEKLSTAFYEKVTSQLNDWSGKYLLVVENDVNQALCGISTTSTKYGLGFSVDIDNNKIVASGLSAYEVVIAKASVTADAYTMTFNGSQLYWGSGNSLNVNVAESVNTNWTISLSNGKLSIYNCKDVNRQLLWNKSSPRFACYTGKEEDPAYFYPHLYKLVDDNQGGEVPEPEQPVAPKIEVASAAQSIGAEGGDLEFEYTVTNSDSEPEATVTQGTDFLESVEVENGIIAVTVKENETASERVAKITLTCGDATPVVLTITQEGKVVVDDSFEPGLYWIMATEDGTTKVMTPLGETANYGYGQSTTVTDGRSYARNAFTFTAVEGGFTIQDVLGRYYYTTDEHKSFQLSSDPSADGLVWTVGVGDNGTVILTNVGTSRTLKYGDGTYTTFGVYKDSEEETGVYPTLVKADNPLPVELSSISVNGHKTSFAEGDTFEFGGTVTANYSDGTTKNVTANASVTTPEMVNGASVTVSYTEGGITKTFSYTIVVRTAGGEVTGGSETFNLKYSATDVKKADWSLTQNSVSLYWSVGENTSNNIPSPNKEGSVRMYTGTTLTIEVPQGAKITRVVFTPTSNSYNATKLKYDDVALASDDWSLSTPENPIVLTASANARFKEITVYYE